jgi:hypothetical protein
MLILDPNADEATVEAFVADLLGDDHEDEATMDDEGQVGSETEETPFSSGESIAS